MSLNETFVADMNVVNEGGEKKPYLTLAKGAQVGQIFELNKPELLVGRADACDLKIEDNSISRNHFKLYVQDGQLRLEDLGSTNGTYVNGEETQQIELHDGDRIQISPATILEVAYLDEAELTAEQQRYEKGVKDPGTGVYNKGFFLDRLADEFSFAKRQGTPLALIMMDIDHFKKLNDNYGHLLGDKALRTLTKTVAPTIRGEDVLCRYGGEEFAVIMRGADAKAAMNLAERIREQVSQIKLEHEGQIITYTVSLGVAAYHVSLADPQALIQEADHRLYQSKENGRNQVTGP